MTSKEIISILKSKTNHKNLEGMAHFGINTSNAFGISIPNLKELAKRIGKNHSLAIELWKTGFHESRILACLIDEAGKVSEKQMNEWVMEFDSWDLCDQCCMNLFDKTKLAYKKIRQWTKAKEEFVKRAGFAIIASLAVHDKVAKDEIFMKFLSLIKNGSVDERNYVKKAVNWALRQIGKRNQKLNRSAIVTSKEIINFNSKSAQWIAKDALRELTSDSVQRRTSKNQIPVNKLL